MLVLFFLVWLILNGRITLEICVFGAVISAVLFYFICRFMDYSWEKEKYFWRIVPLSGAYFWVLVKEIVKANVCVLRMILSPRLVPEPMLVYFKTDLKTNMAKVILANSITLTPGTITVSVEGDVFCVHCLDKELAEGIENSVFVQLLERMEALKRHGSH